MRILDASVGVGMPAKSDRYSDMEGLVKCLDDYRISQAVVYNTEATRDPWDGNARMKEFAADYAGRIKPCMWLDASLDDLGLPGAGGVLDRLSALRPSAVRVMQGEVGHLPMDKFYAQDLLKPLNEARMPLIIDGAYTHDFFRSLPDMAGAFPNVPFIILRKGLNESRIINPLLKYTNNVYFDISIMLDCGQIEELVEKFGGERLLFASGLPQYSPAGVLALLLYTEIPEDERLMIAHGSFERLEGGIRL